MEAVVRGHARISQIVLDTGASKDLVLDTGAGKDLDSIVARDEGDLPEVGCVGMHDSEDRVSTSRTGSRFSTGRWQGAAGGWCRLSGPVNSCLFTYNNVLMFFALATRGLCLITKAKQVSHLPQKVAEQFLQLLLATLQLFVGAADMDIMFRLPGLAEQL